jgi:Flp pilus assembly protein TadD
VYAVALREAGRREDAIAVLRKALRKNPEDEELAVVLKQLSP